MKTKILVAMIACLAIGACSKTEVNKEENKTESTQPAGKTEPAPGTGTTTPSAPAGGHSSIESTTNLAADESAANAAAAQTATTAQDADKKLQEMKQDMSNTSNQIQGSTTSVDASKTEAHTHAED